jgi:hypothetical protein
VWLPTAASEPLWHRGRQEDPRQEGFLRDLHTRIYGDIWTWAGRWRQREVNIGLAPEQIAVELRNAFDKIRYRWDHTDDWTPHELGIATHAETVRVHPLLTEMAEQQDFSPSWYSSPSKIRLSSNTTGMSTRSATSVCFEASMSTETCATSRPLSMCNPLRPDWCSSHF